MCCESAAAIPGLPADMTRLKRFCIFRVAAVERSEPPEEVQTYVKVFDQLAALASYGAAARALITQVLLDREVESGGADRQP